MRSAEGDRFFMLATDLSIYNRSMDWNGTLQNGSHHIEVWESTELVSWGEQRHVEVNLPTAGMTWAPACERLVHLVSGPSSTAASVGRPEGPAETIRRGPSPSPACTNMCGVVASVLSP